MSNDNPELSDILLSLRPWSPLGIEALASAGRRLAERRRMIWRDRTVHITIGYDESGRQPVEIFYNSGCPSGSDMEALIVDLCHALSVMLRHEDISAQHLQRSMTMAPCARTGKTEPASVLGLLLHEIMRPPVWLPQEREPWPKLPVSVEKQPGCQTAPQKTPRDKESANECDPGFLGTGAASAAPASGNVHTDGDVHTGGNPHTDGTVHTATGAPDGGLTRSGPSTDGGIDERRDRS